MKGITGKKKEQDIIGVKPPREIALLIKKLEEEDSSQPPSPRTPCIYPGAPPRQALSAEEYQAIIDDCIKRIRFLRRIMFAGLKLIRAGKRKKIDLTPVREEYKAFMDTVNNSGEFGERRSRRIRKCKRCGRERDIIARGLCASCYNHHSVNFKIAVCRRCKKERQITSHGLCRSCYNGLSRRRELQTWLSAHK